jgi:hypothetical protein
MMACILARLNPLVTKSFTRARALGLQPTFTALAGAEEVWKAVEHDASALWLRACDQTTSSLLESDMQPGGSMAHWSG